MHKIAHLTQLAADLVDACACTQLSTVSLWHSWVDAEPCNVEDKNTV